MCCHRDQLFPNQVSPVWQLKRNNPGNQAPKEHTSFTSLAAEEKQNTMETERCCSPKRPKFHQSWTAEEKQQNVVGPPTVTSLAAEETDTCCALIALKKLALWTCKEADAPQPVPFFPSTISNEQQQENPKNDPPPPWGMKTCARDTAHCGYTDFLLSM